jgi:magnesium-transporting ATPase (P-type)
VPVAGIPAREDVTAADGNEAALTGESLLVEKHAEAPGASGDGIARAATAVFLGTAVTRCRRCSLPYWWR